METIVALIGVLSLLVLPICLIAIVVQAIRKKAVKKWGIAAISSVLIFIVAMIVSIIMTPTCDHIWEEANCEKARICSLCGLHEGEPLGHDFATLKTVRDATCIDAGYREGACARCGDIIREEIPIKAHNLEISQILKEATCTEKGEVENKCTNCDYTEKETVSAKGHIDGEWEISQEATYFAEGIRSIYCTECKEVIRTEEYELSKEEKELAFLQICEHVDYESIARYPEKYIDKPITFKGEVVQVVENGNDYTLRIDITWNGYFYEDTVWVEYTRKDSDDGRVLEGDILTVYGLGADTKTYSSVLLSQITIPAVKAEYIYY